MGTLDEWHEGRRQVVREEMDCWREEGMDRGKQTTEYEHMYEQMEQGIMLGETYRPTVCVYCSHYNHIFM